MKFEDLNNRLQEVPSLTEGELETIFESVDRRAHRRSITKSVLSLLLIFAFSFVVLQIDDEPSTTVAAEAVEEELQYMVNYFNGEDVEDEYEFYYAFSDEL